MHLVDLLSNSLLGCGLFNPSEESNTWLGVGEVLAVKDLKIPILLDKSEDGDNIVGKRAPKDGRDHPCSLRCGYVLWSEMTLRFCVEGRTWMTTFPGASITS